MNKFDVNICVPAQDGNSDIILISGVPTNVDAAKIGLAEKITELKAEKEVKKQKSFEVKIKVDSKYRQKIIGKGGKRIKRLRGDFNVQIQLPKKEQDKSEMITITGLEAYANAAKEAILKIVGRYESMVQEEVSIDPRVHFKKFGKRGRSIRKIMDDFKVDICLPREGDADPSLIVVTGDKDAVLNCIDHLKIMEEKFIKDAVLENIVQQALKNSIVKARVKELDNIVEDSMTVDPKHHSQFVARRDEVLRRIGDEFGGVVVSFPRNGVAGDKVNLKGTRNCIDAAITRIREIVKDPNLQMSKVSADVDAAKISLAEKVTELEAEKEVKKQKRPKKVKVHVNPENRPKIIGERGRVIKKLREIFDVQIQLPEEGSDHSEVITITGFEADEAKEAILKIVGQHDSLVQEEDSDDADLLESPMKVRKIDRSKIQARMNAREEQEAASKKAEKEMYHCNNCQKDFQYLSTFTSHLSVSHGNEAKLLNLKYMYKTHEDGHSCTECGQLLSTNKGLALHLGRGHGLIWKIDDNIKPMQAPLQALQAPLSAAQLEKLSRLNISVKRFFE